VNTNIGIRTFFDDLEQQLVGLPHLHQLAFAASCCERAYLNYVDFSRQARWGDAKVLRESLHMAWEIVDGKRPNVEMLLQFEGKCQQVTPDLDDFSSPDIDVAAAAGQEAAFMVTLLLRFCREIAPVHAVSIARFAFDTIDMYVQVREELNPNDPQLEDKIDQHPITQAELRAQRKDLLTLVKVQTVIDLRQFIKRAIAPAASNIGTKVDNSF
jgi:uncharacterized protein YjaG (DUF416 family)